MKKEDVLKLISGGEGQRLEFKAGFNNSVIETLVAFCNASGGRVLLGVDNDGSVMGIDIGKESIQKWLNEIKLKSEYKVLPDVEVFKIDKKSIVVLSINEYPSKPSTWKR